MHSHSGNFMVEQLSEGFFEIFEDGTFCKMDPGRLDNPADDPSLGKYSSALGIDPLLIQKNDTRIVIDPGLGWGLDHQSTYRDTSNVVTNLDIFEIDRHKIDFVILSHLHYDHTAGCTFVNNEFKTSATFPNARYLVHRDEWNFALNQINKQKAKHGATYNLDEFYKLVAEQRVDFIDGEIHSPVDGITMIKTGGHTPGHLVVRIENENSTAFFMGDLIPTEYHLNHYAMKLIDADPVQSKKAKKMILKEALNKNATVFFYHSLYNKSGLISQDNHKKFILTDRK